MIGVKQKENRKESHRTSPSRVEVFKWLLKKKTEINKMDVDRVKTRIYQ